MTHPGLDEFVQKLKAAAGENLKAVILYGSAANGEFHSRHSDLNLLCILNSADAVHIQALHSTIEWWSKRGLRAPLVFTVDELSRSADVFAIEMLDMKSCHKVLAGVDVLADISVPLRYHAIQVERELRTNWLRLRQAILAAPKKPKIYRELMVSSFSAFVALFRHALIARGEPPAESRRGAIERIAEMANADPVGFYAILEHREGKREAQEIDIGSALNRYVAFVEAVTDAYDRWLDTKV